MPESAIACRRELIEIKPHHLVVQPPAALNEHVAPMPVVDHRRDPTQQLVGRRQHPDSEECGGFDPVR
jgi:hypothetical protein